ncbi:ATP-binding protein [Streptomyces tagetis]|uniref:ATP-binding protein n=1 Tax=Streptomyces tagetis TaxID=2820809 RepID=A0A940XM81_9ACTN|nr:ATP-binding protein [Streptomyces sp. RG38]MBQ0827129.1 ATP-binding protein [Streptomyces sp. RG38]
MTALLDLGLTHRHYLTLPTRPGAVRLARETAELALAEWGVDAHHPAVGPALLILGELVANSVRHAAPLSPQVTVGYGAGPGRLAFTVHDLHPGLPPLREAVSGGLATVRELVLGLGGTAVVRADADGRGKSVGVSLPL